MRVFLLINRGLTLLAIVPLFLLMVLAALVTSTSAVSAHGAVPDAPDRPVGTAVFVGGVDLEWNDVPGADSYGVQMFRNGQWTDLPGDGVEIAFYGAGAIISELEPDGSSYWFRVRAESAHGFSEWSDYNFMAPTSQSNSGRRAKPDNVPASGAPVISGRAQVGESLTADATGIEDGNGLERVQFRYQWVSHDESTDKDIASATGSTYTLAASDKGKTIRIRVAFTDRGGYGESLSSAATATVTAAPNSPATGAPAVTGTAQVGETLTADTSGIADTDGLTDVTYSYQWITNDGTADSDISGETDAAYTLVADDEGKTVKVEVTFTDDAGYEATLTSGATAAVAAPECDNIGDCDIEDVDDLLLPDLVGYPHEFSMTEVVVAPDGTVLHALRFGGYVTNLGDGPLDLKGNPQLADSADLTSHDVWQRALTIDGDWVNLTKPPIKFETADGHNHFHLMGIVEYSLWDPSGTVEIRSGAKVGFCLVDILERPDLHPNPGPERYKQSNSDNLWCQAGRPGAKMLRMGISEGWQDIYSFSATFQWIDVSDVRPGYYRVGQRADPDNVIVESDETNNGLALSQGLHVVPGYIARPETVRVEPDATVRFKLSADEYFDDTVVKDGSPRTRVHYIVTQPSRGSLDVGDTVTVIGGAATTHQVFNDEWVTYTPEPGFAGVDSFTFVALDESRPRFPINPVVAKVTLDVSRLSVTVNIDNAPAWIAPGSSIDLDATVNGATSDVTWSVDGVEGGSDEAGMIYPDGRYTAPIVPPVSGTVTVRAASTQVPAAYAEVVITVSFAVQQQTANNPATGAPTITGIAQVGETLTADTPGIADDDGLVNTTYSYQWVANDGITDTDISGETDAAYTLVADDEGQTIKVEVSFTDDAGNYETLSSAATDAVAAPEPPAKPTGLSAAVSHDTVTLTWDDPQDDSITGYVILRRDRAIHPTGTFVTIAGDTGSADTAYTDDTVDPDREYVYRIKAINDHGKVSEISDWVRGFTPAVPVPDKPTGLSAAVSHDTVTITWDDPQDDSIIGYVILRRDREIHPAGTFVTIAGDTGSADTAYTDDTVDPDKEYVYRIKAINEHGKVSEISDWVRGFTPAAPAPAGSPAQ